MKQDAATTVNRTRHGKRSRIVLAERVARKVRRKTPSVPDIADQAIVGVTMAARHDMMTHMLKMGDCLFYKDKPMRLLYKIREGVWRVRPIFLDGEDYDQAINPNEDVTLLHCKTSAM